MKNQLSKDTMKLRESILSLDKKDIRKIATNLQTKKSSDIVAEATEIAYILINLDNFNEIQLAPNGTKALKKQLLILAKNEESEELIDQVKSIKFEEEINMELAITNNGNVREFEESTKGATINVENLKEIVAMFFAMQKATQGTYKFEDKPSFILSDILSQTGLADRIVDVAFVLTYGYPDIDTTRHEAQFSDVEILNKYDKEQIARREMAINASMASKPPSDKQREVLAKKMVECRTAGLIDLANKCQKLMLNFNATAFDYRELINTLFEELSSLPITENQAKMIKSMKEVGFKFEGTTRGEASIFIAKNSTEFSQKSFVKLAYNYGLPNIEDVVANWDDKKIQEYTKALKKVGTTLQQCLKYTQENIWTLIDKLNNMDFTQLLELQKACLTKNMEEVESIL